MTRYVLAAVLATVLLPQLPAGAATLEQIVSREDPTFNVAGARLTIGRDGLVYLASGGNDSFTLRIARDGKDKVGGATIYAAQNATANAAGVIATANGHFSHSVQLYKSDFSKLAAVADFLNSDKDGWDAPAYVEAGAGGDFYGLDQHRDRVLRLTADGKVVKSYQVPHEPAGGPGTVFAFRVSEKAEALYTCGGGKIRCVGFDGQTRWDVPGIGGGTYEGLGGGFDCDDAGTLYVIGDRSDTVKKYDADGKPAGDLKLAMGDLKPTPAGPSIAGLRVFGGDLLIKRRHPTELFQCYDLATGALKTVATSDHERLAVDYAKDVWTAGEPVDFRIDFAAPGRQIRPRWRVWAAPFGTADYRELALSDGKLQVPEGLAGLYKLKVSPEVQPVQRGTASEYLVRTVVEVRKSGAKGSAAVVMPLGRARFGRGEAIPFFVIVRGPEAGKTVAVVATFTDGKATLAEMKGDAKLEASQLAPGEHTGGAVPPVKGVMGATGLATFTIEKSLTAALKPGKYWIAVSAADMTCVGQAIEIGPGVAEPPFHVIQYGDYGQTFVTPKAWESPDLVAGDLARKQLFGFNLYVDRLGEPLLTGTVTEAGWKREASDVAELRKRLDADPLAVTPEKLAPVPPMLQTMDGYSALGIQEMAILMGNDAGLPLGTGCDTRKPEQLIDAVRAVTKALLPYPAMRGWSWSSNWWVFQKTGAAAAKKPEEKRAYEEALKAAKDTGAWDPILEKVPGYWLGYAPEACENFGKTLREVTPRLVTAVACPYRNVASYPPISLAKVDESDCQAQWEQIGVPYHVMYNVDFYKRPGRRAWAHPEIWNDCGTGDQVVPALLEMAMRGADGVGCSGPAVPWTHPDTLPDDPRSSHYGLASVWRAANGAMRAYGPWLATLHGDDRVAIIASGRMFKIDDWAGIQGRHFARLFEAYITCLHAHRPAAVVFAEDMKADTLRKFKAVLLVGQRVELEPKVVEAIKAAKATGATIFCDGTCREELVKGYTPLGVSFDKVEKDPNGAGDDSAYLRFRDYARANLPAVEKALNTVLPPVAEVAEDEVLLSQRIAEDARYVFAVNNTIMDIGPGLMWRMNLLLTSRVPLSIPVGLGKDAKVVYDVFAMKQVPVKDGVVQADLRYLPGRVFAILPAAVATVEVGKPAVVKAGEPAAWVVRVHDVAGKPIRASIPVRVRFLDAGGAVLHEETAACGSGGKVATWAVPGNVASGQVTFEATELLSGRVAALKASPATAAASPSTVTGKDVGAVAPVEDSFGPHIRDMVLLDGGSVAVANTMNWDHNLYAIDLSDGKVRWRQRLGDYFAFAPQALAKGFAVQGFDFQSAEGYHLYLAGADGKPERRFALYGVPTRLPHRFVPGILRDRANQFAVADDGSWVAAAGDLGLAVWSRDGKLLWSQDWWKTERRSLFLATAGPDAILAADGMKVVAYDARTGEKHGEQTLARTGEVLSAHRSGDGKTLALRTTTDGGRLFFLRGGQVVRDIATPANDVALTADGSFVAAVTTDLVKLYSLADGLQWTFSGDDNLRFPRFSPGGQRLAVTSDLGNVYVLDLAGKVLFQRDLGARAVPAWMADGSLVLGTWEGRMMRLDKDYKEKWQSLLRPEAVDGRGKILSDDKTPTSRIAGWGNAEPQPADPKENLLTKTQAMIKFVPMSGWGGWAELVNDPALLFDGKADPPEKPWIAWDKVGFFAETSEFNYLLIDTLRTQLRLTSITLFEDPAHPESWLRDVRLDYWDAAKELWVTADQLLSNAAAHTHKLSKPIEAARVRLVMPRGLCGNLRLGEVVLSGERLGSSHPDVAAKRPVAVLFDDGEDLAGHLVNPGLGLSFALEGAYSGGRYLALKADAKVGSAFQKPFGHALPNWDFEIAETPAPGQYRYLQLAWKAGSPETEAIVLGLGPQSADIYCGEYKPSDGAAGKQAADEPPQEWTAVTVDLWEVYKRPARIQQMSLKALGGPAAIDQILLKRTPETVPPAKK